MKYLSLAIACLMASTAVLAQDGATANTAAATASANPASAAKVQAALTKAHEASCKTSAGDKQGEDLRAYMRSCVTARAEKAKACRTAAGDKTGPALATAMAACMAQ